MGKGINLTAAEEKLAGLIWRAAPLGSPELVALADKELGWKKSTTYTVLKKLCDKGVFRNDNASVTVALTREELVAGQTRSFVEDTFGGSLPRFVASFIGGGKLTAEQAEELKRLIEERTREERRGERDG
ncbi:MAG: BlaI/MecI/CopY family transcriptional regulator [Oscillospiraceae bacterium]|jgi:predicted transcriptional regulator|nr:BlaI/MecI/CopY family transcriptional regulator [Oscillospiraceae bacterium]